MGVVHIVQRGNLCLPFLLIWELHLVQLNYKCPCSQKKSNRCHRRFLCMQSKNPGNFDLVSGFASDLLNLFTLNNLFFFFPFMLLRFWPGHWNEGLLMCNSVCGLMWCTLSSQLVSDPLNCRCCWGYTI